VTKIDSIAAELRQAFADHDGDKIISWREAAPDRKAAWRAIARKAVELGATAQSR
jgi:hypothetical protein